MHSSQKRILRESCSGPVSWDEQDETVEVRSSTKIDSSTCDEVSVTEKRMSMELPISMGILSSEKMAMDGIREMGGFRGLI